MIHDVKIIPQYYAAVLLGTKRFEYRLNDRDYKIGDVLNLHEYDPVTDEYSGNFITKAITFVVNCNAIDECSGNYVILSI